MSELNSLGIDGNTIDATGVESNAIELNGQKMVIEVSAEGNSGDSDELQIWTKESLGGGRFETEGVHFASIYLDSDTEIVKTFRVSESEGSRKIIVKMVSTSSETPLVRVYFRLLT